jgi:hypothetical protein
MKLIVGCVWLIILSLVNKGSTVIINGKFRAKSTAQYYNISKINNEVGINFKNSGTVEFYNDEDFWTVRNEFDIKSYEDTCKILIDDYNNLVNLLLNKNKLSMSRNLKKTMKKRLVNLYKSIVNFEKAHRNSYSYSEFEETDFDEYLEEKEPTIFTFKDKTVKVFYDRQLCVVQQAPIDLNWDMDDVKKDFIEESIKNLKRKTKMLEKRFKVLKESSNSAKYQSNLIPLKLLNLIISKIKGTTPSNHYKHLEVEVTKYFLKENNFVVDMEIPILTEKMFDLFEIQLFPTKIDGSLGSLLELHCDYFLIERLGMTFTVLSKDDLQECFVEYESKYVCKASSFFHHLDVETKDHRNKEEPDFDTLANPNQTQTIDMEIEANSTDNEEAQRANSNISILDPTEKQLDSEGDIDDTKVLEINCLIETFFGKSINYCKNLSKTFYFERTMIVAENGTSWLFSAPRKVTLPNNNITITSEIYTEKLSNNFTLNINEDGMELFEEEIKSLKLHQHNSPTHILFRIFGLCFVIAINGLLCYIFCRRMKRKENSQIFQA